MATHLNEMSIPTVANFLHPYSGGNNPAFRLKKENRGISILKMVKKLLFRGNTIAYLKNPREQTKKGILKQ